MAGNTVPKKTIATRQDGSTYETTVHVRPDDAAAVKFDSVPAVPTLASNRSAPSGAGLSLEDDYEESVKHIATRLTEAGFTTYNEHADVMTIHLTEDISFHTGQQGFHYGGWHALADDNMIHPVEDLTTAYAHEFRNTTVNLAEDEDDPEVIASELIRFATEWRQNHGTQHDGNVMPGNSEPKERLDQLDANGIPGWKRYRNDLGNGTTEFFEPITDHDWPSEEFPTFEHALEYLEKGNKCLIDPKPVTTTVEPGQGTVKVYRVVGNTDHFNSTFENDDRDHGRRGTYFDGNI